MLTHVLKHTEDEKSIFVMRKLSVPCGKSTFDFAFPLMERAFKIRQVLLSDYGNIAKIGKPLHFLKEFRTGKVYLFQSAVLFPYQQNIAKFYFTKVGYFRDHFEPFLANLF